MLEAVRRHAPDAALLLRSTNKVYGAWDVGICAGNATPALISPWHPGTFPARFPLALRLLKGAGDQYVRDYARIYGLRTLVWRSVVSMGNVSSASDQGWVAHFVIATVLGRPSISIHGDGMRVRDVLHVDDPWPPISWASTGWTSSRRRGSTWRRAAEHAGHLDGVGPLADLAGRPVAVTYGPWRPGDQRVSWPTFTARPNGCLWRPARLRQSREFVGSMRGGGERGLFQ